ncbi:MAG: DUF368 domain-containing protein [Candidatus Omnitrophica bacterium]|nr:DUF368 domain-containing protein [Candidatus Omnitrophota bacterium]MDD5487358.1 DUF368 domain-containing protein [Candidatus Omnitrophota bacterium]
MGCVKENTIVVIPSFNEARTIDRIVREIAGKGLKVLVIDDGSTDDTARIAVEAGAEIIQHKKNKGKGFSVREGLEHVINKTRFEWILLMDGDGQHDTANIGAMMAAAVDADIVSGDRMADTRDMPAVRYWTNRFMSWFISNMCGQKISDTQCGYRLLRAACFRDTRLCSKNFDIETEMLIIAARRGARIKSVPIRTIYGEEKSQINPIVDTLRFFRLISRYMLSSGGRCPANTPKRDYDMVPITSLTGAVSLFVKGMVIGVANIIPGVSGGTIAVVLGVYARLIEAISCFFSPKAKKGTYILFLGILGSGAVVAIGAFAGVMQYLLSEHYRITMFLFVGLIAGGVPAMFRAHDDMGVSTTRILAFVMGMILMIGLAMVRMEGNVSGSVEAGSGLIYRSMLVISGFFAGGAMIVPGISGSFMLVLMGQYSAVLNAVREMAVGILFFVGMGAAVGILVFSKIMDICIKKIPAGTYYFILGLIAASIYKIYPGLDSQMAVNIKYLLTAMAGGFFSYMLSRVRV